MPTVQITMAYLRPTTIAEIVADLMTAAQPDYLTIFTLIDWLEKLVGQEPSLDYLIEADVDVDCLYHATSA
jgi:hypothetical protein